MRKISSSRSNSSRSSIINQSISRCRSKISSSRSSSSRISNKRSRISIAAAAAGVGA